MSIIANPLQSVSEDKPFAETGQDDFFAVIDLGSNSFHLLVTRLVAGRFQPIQRIRRKVRLANGLDASGQLTDEAIERGLSCLKLFSDRIKTITPQNIRIVATATLRLAENRAHFLLKAEEVLGFPVNLISGEEEARYIYLGATTTSASSPERLVIDIGGASTEIIVGNNQNIEYLTSLPLGCVTWRSRYFPDNQLDAGRFDIAITAAKEQFDSIQSEIKNYSWKSALSACGTVQTVHEIILAQRLGSAITLSVLYKIKAQLTEFKSIDDINLRGLYPDKVSVFPSGLTILIALFESLGIKELNLAGGALREGVLASFMPVREVSNHSFDTLCKQSIAYLQSYFHIDRKHASRVRTELQSYLYALKIPLKLCAQEADVLLYTAELHELGLSIDLRQSHQHGSYLVQNFPILGFSTQEKQLISTWLLTSYPLKLKKQAFLKQQILTPSRAFELALLMRLAIICCFLRTDTDILKVELSYSQKCYFIKVSQSDLAAHPLLESLLLEFLDDVKHDVVIKLIAE